VFSFAASAAATSFEISVSQLRADQKKLNNAMQEKPQLLK